MTKKEAKVWKTTIKEHVESLKDSVNIDIILNKLTRIKTITDNYDLGIINSLHNKYIDLTARNKKDRCIKYLNDIIDFNPSRYSEEDSKIIVNIFKEIMSIDDRSFWEKFIGALFGC